MAFTKKKGDVEETKEPVDYSQPLPFPMRFIATRQCEKSFVLICDEVKIIEGGIRHTIPGVRIVPRPLGGYKDVRVIELEHQACCTRANNRKSAEEVSALIMADKRYSGEGPCILSYDEWKENEDFRKKRAAERKKEDEEFVLQQRAKFGKRGVSA